MKKLLSFFVVLVVIIPMAIYGQTIHSVTVSKDTVDMNEKLEISVIWSSSSSAQVKTLVNYQDGKIDSVLTNPTPNTQYLSKFFHYYNTPGTFNILVTVGIVSATKTVIVRGNPNQAPIVSNVIIIGGNSGIGVLVGSYIYSDADGDLEGISTYKWYRNNVAIAGATSQTYVKTAADLGAMIKFEVTPVAQTGVLVGLSVQSSEIGPIVNPNASPIIISVSYTGVVYLPGSQIIGLSLKDDGTNLNVDAKIYSLPNNNLVNHQNISVSITPNSPVAFNLQSVNLPIGDYSCYILVSDGYLDVSTNFTFKVESMPTAVEDESIPVEFQLSQNYPNPFNPTTSIKYSLPEATQVNLIIYDMLGREVVTMVNEYKNAGVHNVKFDASSLSTGVYIYRIVAGKFVETKKMTLMK